MDFFTRELINHPGESAAYPLAEGMDAFVARVALVKLAKKTLDLQYYIWHSDETGHLLAGYLLEAADRGVYVRLLLDDVGSPLGDEHLLMLSLHPNIDVKLFNPLANRAQRLLSMVTNFARANRRMHNKSLMVDNSIAIVGGRNVGNEYFDANHEVAFADLDVMVMGPVVDEVAQGFELFWNSDLSILIERLTRRMISDTRLTLLRKKTYRQIEQASETDYVKRMMSTHFAQRNGSLDWYWGKASVLYDHPDKATDKKLVNSQLLSTGLSNMFEDIQSELILVTPYLVPGKQGVELFRQLVAKGVKVTLVTNALAATDVVAVHSGYAKYRKALLKVGVDLYEVRPDSYQATSEKSGRPGVTAKPKTKESLTKRSAKKISSMATREGRRNLFHLGSSARASLHAKAFFVDRKRTFIGSLNLDPRSFLINTEIGVLFDNKEMAGLAFDQIHALLKTTAYRLQLDERNRLTWLYHKDDKIQTSRREPGVALWKKITVTLLSLLPIESQL